MAHAANSARASYRLKPLCEKLFGISTEDQSDLRDSTVLGRRVGKKLGYRLSDDVEADYWLGDPSLCEKYAIQDTQRTMRLFKSLQPLLEITEQGPFSKFKEIVEMEHKFQMAVLAMNLRGVRVDPEKIAELKSYYSSVLAEENEKVVALGYADLNPRSSKQKNEIFYQQLGFEPVKRKRKGKDGATKQTISVDKKVLEKLSGESPLAKSLLTTSEAQHQLNSFILPFERESVEIGNSFFLFPCFNSVGPRTGRLSCSQPNLQNITSETSPLHKTDVKLRARECFIPRSGHAWLLADYAQIEIWVAAYLSKDYQMCKILSEGKSVHDLTCDRVFAHKADFATNRPMYRKLAKILTFSILYGSGPKALSELLNVTYDEAKVYYNNFWKTYQGLREYSDSLVRQVDSVGYAKDLFGRPFFLDKRSSFKILNYVIQGTAAAILKRAHLNVNALLAEKYPSVEVALSVHDELCLELPQELASDTFVSDVVTAMQGNFHTLLGLPKPFTVECSFVLNNWSEKIKYEAP